LPTWISGCQAFPSPTDNPWNPPYMCSQRDLEFWSGMEGFQWYDTGQQHLVSNSTFRNCNAQQWAAATGGCSWGCGGNGSSVFTLLTHSDQYVPQIMQSTEQIYYENVDETLLWQTSTQLSDYGGVTVSGRLQNWLDVDGSASGVFPLGTKTKLGSTWSNEWWRYNDDCVLKQQFWVCPLQEGDSAAEVYLSFDITYHGWNQANIGGSLCVNGNFDQNNIIKCPVIGQVTHFGRARGTGLDLAMNAQITGPIIQSAGGWFIEFTYGVPTVLEFIQLQVNIEDTLIVAIPYPPSTTFSIVANAATWCQSDWGTCTHPFTQVNSLDQVIAGFGDLYFFDGVQGVLYVKVLEIEGGDFGYPGTVPAIWTSLPDSGNYYFRRDGMYLADMNYDGEYALVITAKNCNAKNGVCAVNSNAMVPPAFVPPPPTTSQPTVNPTIFSTLAPTLRPTPMPSFRPTVKPTSRPTTSTPTHLPTSRPTTSTPTHLPTHLPTQIPTFRPSARPSGRPSLRPTSTNAPTSRPTHMPINPSLTKSPTKFPTKRRKGGR